MNHKASGIKVTERNNHVFVANKQSLVGIAHIHSKGMQGNMQIWLYTLECLVLKPKGIVLNNLFMCLKSVTANKHFLAFTI